MSKKLPLFISAILLAIGAKAQFDFPALQYYVGTGSDTAMLVIDFKDGSTSTVDSSFAWGFLFNDSTTGEDMLSAIAAADINLSVNITTGFLSDVQYGVYSGIGGQPNYWSTWSGNDLASLTTNMGLSTTIYNKQWFATAYSFTSAPTPGTPGQPIPAYDPSLVTFNDVDLWIGSGQDSAVLVVDFLSLAGFSSHSVGILFNDSISGENMLNAFSSYDSTFKINMSGGFLNDITYAGHTGLGGQPNYWGTWSATNWGDWHMNFGIGTMVKNGEWFGCTYTDFNPALRPTQPHPVQPIGIKELTTINFSIYPNPAVEYIYIDALQTSELDVNILSLNGQSVLKTQVQQNEKLQVGHLPKGTYLLQVAGSIQKLIIN